MMLRGDSESFVGDTQRGFGSPPGEKVHIFWQFCTEVAAKIPVFGEVDYVYEENGAGNEHLKHDLCTHVA